MADEELHETDSNNQKDWQSETSSSTVADETASKDTEQNAENASAEEGAAYGVNMEQVQAVLNATADKATLTPQMQRMMNRQAENTKRVYDHRPDLVRGVLPLPVRFLADSEHRCVEPRHRLRPDHDRIPDDDGMALSSGSLRLSIGRLFFSIVRLSLILMRKADLPYAEVGLFRALACSSTAIHHLSTTYPLRYPQPVDELHPCSFPPNVENHVDKWWISGVSRCISRA